MTPLAAPPPTLRESLLAAGVAALAAALLLAPALFGPRCTLAFTLSDPRVDVLPWARPAAGSLPPVNLLTPDTDLYVLPGLLRVQQLRAAGDSIDWEPRQLLGYPLAANVPLPFEQPFAALLSRLAAVDALDWLLWLHLALAGALAWRAGRLLGLTGPAAWLAAAGFSLSAWMSTRWHLPHLLYALAFWPGVLGGWGWILRGRATRGALEAGLFLGLSLLSFPQVGSVALAGFAVLVLGTPGSRTAAGLAALVGAAVLGLLLAAPQLFESGRAYSVSLRGSAETRAATVREGLRPGALFGLLLPEFFGRVTDFSGSEPPAPTHREYWPHRRWLGDDTQENPVENALHPGLLVLLLLPLLARRGSCGLGRRLAALGAAVLGLALIWPALVAAVPALEVAGVGSPKRLLALVAGTWPFAAAFALPGSKATAVRADPGFARALWLSAAGWLGLLALLGTLVFALGGAEADAFVASLGPQRLRAAVLVVLAVAGLLLARRGGVLALLPALLLAADLSVHALRFNPFPLQEPPFPATAATEALAAQPGRYVVFGRPNLLPPGAAAVVGLSSAQGVAGLVPRRTAELLAQIEGPLFEVRDPRVARPLRDPPSLSHPLLDLLCVDTIVHADVGLQAASGLPSVGEWPAEGLAALRRPTAGPRAFTTTAAIVVPEPAARLQLLADRARDPHAAALLERPTRAALPASGRSRPARVLVDRADRRVLATDEPEPSVLVLVESWDPGWSVTVNGDPAELLVSHHALLAVELPGGSHEVEFRYAGGASGLGRAAGWLGWVALIAGVWWQCRRPHGPASASR